MDEPSVDVGAGRALGCREYGAADGRPVVNCHGGLVCGLDVASYGDATLKAELVYRVVLATKPRARRQLIRWFDRYNQTRRHSHCGWRAPIAYEKITTKRGAPRKPNPPRSKGSSTPR